jgi:adenylate cyclase
MGSPSHSAPVTNRELAERVRHRYGSAGVAANAVGGLAVFLFLMFVLPTAGAVHHSGTVAAVNVGAFVLYGAITFPLTWRWSRRLWHARLGWIDDDRDPTEQGRALTLRYPLSQQAIVARMWAIAAVLFGALNAPFSLEVASNVAIGTVLGGIVTCALGYLLGERILRPVTALALAGGVPARPQLPGVAARALLSWTAGAGVILLGLALIGIGGLHEKRFTVARLSVAILVLSVIGIVVGIITMVALARSLADPIESLRDAVAGLEQGRLDVEVTVDDGSEVGLLQAGFNRMLAGLRERERLRDLFGRQVGEDVVAHALDHGVRLGGEAREAAVLFADIEGSTALASRRDPAEVVSLLNAFFAIVVEVVAEHHGWVNKFEGDAALCVFGAPLPDHDAASNALAAARRLGERLQAELDQVSVGIGVSAGRVVAGNIGAAKRFEYTVIGDPVNEAARLTELAKQVSGRVLASAAALERARPDEAGHWELGDARPLRGRSTPTRLAQPVPVATGRPASLSPHPSRPAVPDR